MAAVEDAYRRQEGGIEPAKEPFDPRKLDPGDIRLLLERAERLLSFDAQGLDIHAFAPREQLGFDDDFSITYRRTPVKLKGGDGREESWLIYKTDEDVTGFYDSRGIRDSSPAMKLTSLLYQLGLDVEQIAYPYHDGSVSTASLIRHSFQGLEYLPGFTRRCFASFLRMIGVPVPPA
jgi:hypothetical protein